MLKTLIIAGSFCTLVNANAHTFEVGAASVPGACIESDFPNRGLMPRQSNQNLVVMDGKQSVSVVVLPSRMNEQLSPKEATELEHCVIESSHQFGLEKLVRSSIEMENKLASQISVCLRRSSINFTVRFASVRSGPIECQKGRLQ